MELSTNWTSIIVSVFIAVGGAAGFVKLYLARAENSKIKAEADKLEIDAAEVFSQSVLRMLNRADTNAAEARKEAEAAHREAQLAREELAQLRVWIISQGLTPPDPRSLRGYPKEDPTTKTQGE